MDASTAAAGSVDDPGSYAGSEPNPNPVQMMGSSGTRNGTSSSELLEHERQFMQNMNLSEDMLPLFNLGGDESGGLSLGFGQGQVSSNCMDSMYEVGQSYRSVHGYISLLVCIAGILMNIMIVMVLTRKEMRSPINRMLTALAVADMLVMIEYIPFTLHMYIFELPQQEQYSHAWAVFVLFHSHFTQILHTINIQLTITMSIWRYVALKQRCCGGGGAHGPAGAGGCLTMGQCNFCIFIAYLCPVLICIPNYLTFSIYHREVLLIKPPLTTLLNKKEVDLSMESSIASLCMRASKIAQLPMDFCSNAYVKQDWYTVGLSQMAKANNGLLHSINFWFYSVFVKLIPCFVLTFFMCWLIKTLYKANRRHKMLQRSSPAGGGLPLATVAGSCSQASGGADWDHDQDRRSSISSANGANGVSGQIRRYSQQHQQLLLRRTSLGNGLIEEKDEETTTNSQGGNGPVIDDDKSESNGGGNEINQDRREGGLTEAEIAATQPPSVIYTPVSPLMSQHGGGGAGDGPIRMVANPSYARTKYTTLTALPIDREQMHIQRQLTCNGNGNLTASGRRGSNFSIGSPSSGTQLLQSAPATSRDRRISFEDEVHPPSGFRRFFPTFRDRAQQQQAIPEPRRRSSSTTTLGTAFNNMADSPSPPHASHGRGPGLGHLPPRLRHSFGSKKSGKRSDRTSKLLIAVLCLFLLTEFPQGIMAFLSGVYGEQFFRNCYNTWAEVWDILALINSAINFILYCFMSKQFRLQFGQLFHFQVGKAFKRKCSVHSTLGGASKANGTGNGVPRARASVTNHNNHQSELPTIV